MIRAQLSSSMRVSRGRFRGTRRLTAVAGLVSPAIPCGCTVTGVTKNIDLAKGGLSLRPGAGTEPSVPGCGGSGSEASRERVVAGEHPIRDGDLTPASDAVLLPGGRHSAPLPSSARCPAARRLRRSRILLRSARRHSRSGSVIFSSRSFSTCAMTPTLTTAWLGVH